MLLPRTFSRQTALFSTAQTKKVEDLARLSFQTTQVYIYVDNGRSRVTNEGLQGYCVVPSAKRFILLYSFLKMNFSKKVMVFFSSCNSVKFHSELLKYIQVDCFDIHGKQKQQKQTSTFFDFCKQRKESCCVLMLLLVVTISLRWTGLCSMILQTSQRSISIVWVVLLVEKVKKELLYFSSSQKSCSFFATLRCIKK